MSGTIATATPRIAILILGDMLPVFMPSAPFSIMYTKDTAVMIFNARCGSATLRSCNKDRGVKDDRREDGGGSGRDV